MNNPFELQKRRKLFFKDTQPEQVEQAYLLLSSMDNLKVQRGDDPTILIISYSIEHYSHEGLECALIKEGFQFRESFFRRLFKAVVHYCEDVQQHNLSEPEHHTKKNEAGVFAKAYGQHPTHHHDNSAKNIGEYK
ncbi:MAG: hypothetical protein Q8O24_02495 [Gallionellaceae bacterium]|nr:hypothetical protein [Gallionellaceae bacterium]